MASMRSVAVVAMVTVLGLAGCMGGPGEPEARLHGSFSEDWSSNQTAMADFRAETERYGAEVDIMESFPEQFTATLAETECFLLRTALEDKPYIQNIGACQRIESQGQQPY